MEKLKFALLVFTVLLAFPVITILELKRNPQSTQREKETGKRVLTNAATIAHTGSLFKNNKYHKV